MFALDDSGAKAGSTVATGSGTTQQAARADALALASDPGIRAALASADPTRPHWVQGVAGEKQEAERKAAANQTVRRVKAERPPSAR